MVSPAAFPLRACFVALPLEGLAHERYREIQERLRPYEEILRFQHVASVHLTLMYWPEVMAIEYGQIRDQLEKIAARISSFTMRVTGVSTFGSRGEDHVLFLDIAFSDALARLKKMCPWPNVKPFAPHITLARVQHPQRFHVQKNVILKLLKNAEFTMPCDRLRLYAEIEGKKQTPLEDFVFGGAG